MRDALMAVTRYATTQATSNWAPCWTRANQADSSTNNRYALIRRRSGMRLSGTQAMSDGGVRHSPDGVQSAAPHNPIGAEAYDGPPVGPGATSALEATHGHRTTGAPTRRRRLHRHCDIPAGVRA